MNVERHRAKRARAAGFTLIDLMVAITIMGVLAGLGFNQYGKYVARARRPEAVMAFRALATAQREYMLTQGKYAGTFDVLGFRVEGGQRISATEIQGRRYNFRLIQDQGPRSWYCIATGNIDGDAFLDVIAASNPR